MFVFVFAFKAIFNAAKGPSSCRDGYKAQPQRRTVYDLSRICVSYQTAAADRLDKQTLLLRVGNGAARRLYRLPTADWLDLPSTL